MAESRSVVVRLSAETAQYIREMQKAGTVGDDAMSRVEKSSMSADRAIDKIGSTAGKVALGGMAALIGTGKAAMDWESQWAGVEKTVDGTASQMAALEAEIRGLAKTMPATHQEIAATAEAAGQLGVAREDIVDFTKTMVQLGETTNLTSDEAATSIAQFMNVMKSSADDVDQIGNTLVDLGNKGASTEKQILDMAQRVSGAGALIGASEQDVLALSSAMANLGIQSELGGGAIQRVFTNIYQAAADGADGLTGFAQVAGMTADDFAEQWANDPIRAFDAFLQGLGRIKEGGGNVVGTLDELGIKGTQNLQVMLRLAGAGDMLTTSLDQSNTAWEQNTALTDEYGKRAETTGAQVQVSWNRIKDAAIEAGDVLLPVVADIASAAGNIADAFGSLPSPVKNASVIAVAGLTGAGGLLWATTKVIGGVRSFQETMDALPGTADKGTRALKGLARAGVGLGVIATVIPIIKSLQEAGDESLPGVESLTNRLLDLQDLGSKGFSVSIGSEFDSLGDSIERLTDKSRDLAASDAIGATVGIQSRGLRDATREVELLDQALAQIATSAGPDVAEQVLGGLVEQGYLTKAQLEAVRGELDAYDEAVAGAANDTKLHGAAASGAAGSTDQLGAALGGAADQAEDFGDVLDRLNEKLNGRADLRDYEAALDDFTAGLKENGNTFDINTEKGRANQAALDNIASSALSVAENMKGAARQKFLTTAIDDLRTMGKQLGLPQSEIKTLIALLREANNADVKPKIDVDAGASLAKIQAVRNSIESLKDRELTITTVYKVVRSATDALPYRGKADGGQILGPGTTTSDSIPAWLSNKEYVIKAAAVDHYGVGFFDDANAMRLAAGGATSGKKPKKRNASGALDSATDISPTEEETAKAADAARLYYEQLAQAERERERIAEATLDGQQRAWDAATDAAKAQVDAAKEMVDTVKANMERLGDAAVSGFDSPLFSKSQSGLWTGGGMAGGGWRAALTGDIEGLRERSSIITSLSDPSLGLSPQALEALLGQASNQQIQAMLAAGEVDDYAALFAERLKLTGDVRAQAGMAGYGTEWASVNGQLVQANAHLANLTAIIAQARPINVTETISAAALAAEMARLQAATGGF